MSLEGMSSDYEDLIKTILDKISDNEFIFDESLTSILTLIVSLKEKSDAINTLWIQRKYSEIPILTRAFMEQQHYLIFILEKNTKQRANAFYYYSKYQSFKKFKMIIENYSDTDVSRKWSEISDKLTAEDPTDVDTWKGNYEKYKNRYESMFPANTPKKKMGKWYDFENPGTIYTFKLLLKYLDESDLYIAMYAPYSDNVHGVNTPEMLSIENFNKETNSGNVTISYAVPSYDLDIIESVMMYLFMKTCDYLKLKREMKAKYVKYNFNTRNKTK